MKNPFFSKELPQVIDWTKMPDSIEPVPTQVNQRGGKLRLTQEYSKGVDDKKCSNNCSCLEPSGTICMTEEETIPSESAPEDGRKPEQTYEELIKHPDFLSDPSRPPPRHWKAMLDEAIQRKEAQRQASLFPGCGPGCGHGIHSLRTCKAKDLNKSIIEQRLRGSTESQVCVDEVISNAGLEPNFQRSLSLSTEISSSSSKEVNAIGEFQWVQIPCAVDSGACAHVTPANLFAILGPPKSSKLLPKYYAADGSEIETLGECSVNAVLENGTELSTSFDVAKITRPLMSVHQMVRNGHQVVFGEKHSYLQLKGGTRVPLRHEGRLYMLDMWVKVPIEIAKSSPFVRQVAPQ